MAKEITTKKHILIRVPLALYLLAIMWIVYGIEVAIPGNFNSWGILPRDLGGLIGIPFAPFIHNGLWHLIGNSIPLTILGVMIQLNNQNDIWDITILGIIITGLGVWLIGGSAYHVGASGLVMVYWAYLIADGWFERSIKSLVLAAITIIFYGWMIYVFLDARAHISWSSHVIGAVAGFLIAWMEYWSRKTKNEQ